ncbi:MAG: tetratricopeptide repeat protein [Myxococcales bacterium]|nr:tetratricopeptide repeat protein [Myxococcales bacterium]
MILAALGVLSARAMAEEDPDTEVARGHFNLGIASYAARDYQGALREFEAARKVKPLPAFDYNIGRCLDRTERYAEAVEAYERYLAAAPAAPDAAEVKERVVLLRARLSSRPVAPPVPPKVEPPPITPAVPVVTAPIAPAVPPPAEAPARRFLVPLLVGGAAVVAAGVGTALVLSVTPEYEKLASGPESCRPCRPEQYSALQARDYAGYALWAVAGAAVAVDAAISSSICP